MWSLILPHSRTLHRLVSCVLFAFFEIHANKLYIQLNSTRLQRVSEVQCVLYYLRIFSLMVDECTLTVDRLSFDAYSWQISFGVEGRILVGMLRAWHAHVYLVRRKRERAKYHPDPDLEHRGGDSEEEESFSLSFSSGRAHIQPSHPIHTHTHKHTGTPTRARRATNGCQFCRFATPSQRDIPPPPTSSISSR